MQSGPDINSYFGSVGWLVDRTSANRQVLGSVWLIRSQIAITCAHILVPYFDVPEALGIDFPHTGKRFGVKELHVHNYYDPWLAKRHYSQSILHPPIELATGPMNVAALTMAPLTPLEKVTVEKVTRMMKRSLPEGEDSALAGDATNLQITSIIQTLLGNRNQGTLTLYDPRNNPIAKFYLNESQVTHVKYLHLTNEEAMYRLLTAQSEETYHFIFTHDFDPEWIRFPAMTKSTAAVLMDAFGRLESYQQFMQSFVGTGVISHAVPALNLDPLQPEMRPPVACVWNHLRHGISLPRLLKACNFDGSIVMGSLKYLRDTGQINNSEAIPATNLNLSKLEIANNCSLDRGTPISCISLDPDSKVPTVETGFVLDPFPQKGEGHYIHSVGLPLTAAGSPLLLNGEVIGIHCGIITEGAEKYAEWIHPSMYISAEHIYQCLDLSPQRKTLEILAYTPPSVTERLIEDVNEEQMRLGVASGSIEPIRPGEVMPFSPNMSGAWERTPHTESERGPGARQSGEYGQMRGAGSSPSSVPPKPAQTDTGSWRLQEPAHIKKKSGFFDSIGGMFKGKGTVENQTVDIVLLRQGLESEKFEKIAADDDVHTGDLVRLRLKFHMSTYVAVLLRHSGDVNVRLVYPEQDDNESEMTKNQTVEVPSTYADSSAGGRQKIYSGIPIVGSEGFEEIVVLTAAKPLVVRLFEAGIEQIFDTIAKNVVPTDMVAVGQFELDKNILTKIDSAPPGSADVLSACVMQIHRGA